jgi:iron(III) transport system substrate-binding protein
MNVNLKARLRVTRAVPAALVAGLAVVAVTASGASAGTPHFKAPINAPCQRLTAVLSNGPDPDADPVGYAQAQVLQLRRIKLTDKQLRRSVRELATAYAAYSKSDGKSKPAKAEVKKAVKAVNAICAGAAAAPARSTGTLTLYSGQHVQTTDALVAGFEKQTGINVQVRNDDEDVLADQIVTEGKNSPADVFYTENAPALQSLQDRGLLAKVNSPTLAHTPARYNSANGDWVGVSARVSVLIYNPSVISKSQLPTSVTQLADAKYKGKLAIAPGESDFQPIVTSYARAYGKKAALKWLEAIKANGASHTYPDNETIADEVNRGGAAFGLVNQYYWYRMRAELGASNVKSKIAYFAPHDPGYVLSISGAGVIKSSKHKADAQKFLAFLVSKQGQQIIAHSISFEYPIDDGVKTSAPETPFDKLQPNSITIGQLGDGSTAISLLRKSGLL